ncbi:glycosyltransferase family 2 protein [Salinibacterium sp. NSLL150]|uniref:glycosyltransferase family A protein n=1 Tax=unclassified Salinibacterium TaxID=2632331 RepID=UPI0018CF8C6B|nr:MULTISPECIES: glycosyltransferase family A protein [unclassified Salinibacterium]MBH0098522.1 glycosyltransferase family 2 protein [Salinibacterium sp. NSLL35]MBH0101277.1 glycosyltransferase family 2 protein [Salinibacterium sp. NSLL150]MBH0104036.1 glycosyltransferase family 2 protein [Salinibacterium sp. NSLL16]MBH0106797.1 glycosyltransferase family 2 protein [Salinibacterium sp. NSLL17]MBH0109431.1 glycosyltransferase family 2 protein [Salinibacterium sp. NG22]
MNSAPIVDVIIPIHDSKRPLERTLESLLASGLTPGTELQITVACHNISAADIAANLTPELREIVRLIECHDNLPSPAGPRALALSQSTARYISFVDSDDTLDPHALAAWVALADKHALDAVIPPERHDTGKTIRTPPVRRFRRGNLDAVRDRVSYRTAPLGLIRRAAIERLGIEFGSGVRNGSDQIFALMLWFGSNAVRFARGGPGYIVGGDAETRVTTQMQPLAGELKATRDLLASPWFAALPVTSRRAIAVKFVRLQLFGGVDRRLHTRLWSAESKEAAAEFIRLLHNVAPGYLKSLSIADVQLCRSIVSTSSDAPELSTLMAKRRAFGRPATVLTHDLRSFFAPDAPLRYMIATVLH